MSKSKKQQVRERRRRQKIRSNLIWGVLGAVGIGVIGLLVWQGVRPAVGIEVEIPANYSEHVEDGVEPGPFPSDPPAGGRHYASEFDAGFYEVTSPQAQVPYPEGYIGHNLEHGYVIFWYNCSLVSDVECDSLKTDIKSVMDDFGGSKLIAFPWPSLDVPVAMTSWGRLQRFDSFESKLAASFIKSNRNKAPEPNAP
jgi:hypothetical protein